MFSDLETHEMFPKQTEKQSKVLDSYLTNQALSWVCRCVSWRETREDEPSGQYHHINKSFRKLVQVWTFHTSRETKSQNSWEVHIGPLVTCSTTRCWTPAPSVLRTILIFFEAPSPESHLSYCNAVFLHKSPETQGLSLSFWYKSLSSAAAGSGAARGEARRGEALAGADLWRWVLCINEYCSWPWVTFFLHLEKESIVFSDSGPRRLLEQGHNTNDNSKYHQRGLFWLHDKDIYLYCSFSPVFLTAS